MDLAITIDRKRLNILPVLPKPAVPLLCSVITAGLNPCSQTRKAQLILCAFFLMDFGQFWCKIQLGPFKHGRLTKTNFLWGYLQNLNEETLTFGKQLMKRSWLQNFVNRKPFSRSPEMRTCSQIAAHGLKKTHKSRRFKRLSCLFITKWEHRTHQSCLHIQPPPSGDSHISFKGLLWNFGSANSVPKSYSPNS